MGIESDQLVYDYLSRVGDLAQQQQLPSGTRMKLVSALRGEIDRQRAKAVSDSPAAVRRILGRLGTPDEVVASASDGDGPAQAPAPRHTPSRAAPPEPLPTADLPAQRVRRRVPGPRTGTARERPGNPQPPVGASPPHLAGMDELGPSDGVDWWRVEPKPFGAGESVAGFTGGVEIPEILKPPPTEEELAARAARAAEEEAEAAGYESEEAAGEATETVVARRRWRPRLRRRAEEAVPRAGFGNPFLLLAAALLVAGALLGNWLALGLGWLLAYGSRRLTPAEVKTAVFGLPGAAVTGGLVWLWGRFEGRWGEPVPENGMRDALAGTWPWVLKGAALASALYLVWRARKR
ncbi:MULTISPECIES: hypothetical protein [unclassified Streptomyces]|uniref:hypothetical protein n=1 Tax=unclassified Streptomyces TaxID=2593676 RepID=UPI0028C44CE3|nr:MULTISPECIES: hypothetical protein [unclassified Streptomyces]WNO73876.1 hypothetical protein RPQ07_20615 [Streptomyces sp. AM8-1-1]